MLTFEIKNIGLVKEAIIEIGGLTVLTGENDTGKSTVCKAIFGLLNFAWIPNQTPKTEIEKQAFIHQYERIRIDLLYAHLISIFKNQIYNFRAVNQEVAEINIKDFLKMKIKDKEEIELKLEKTPFITDATYIETPFILEYSKFMSKSLANLNNRIPDKKRGRITGLPIYVQDLLQKLDLNSLIALEIEENMQEIYDYIKQIINGEVSYDKQQDDFLFKKQDLKESIEITNTATGIKSFGLLQSLIQVSQISPKSVLIIDEPEVHLHPKWQVEYAKVLVKLVEVGIPVIISTHSGTMLDALETYANRSEIIKDKAKFYFGINTKNGSVFEDVTQETSKIYHEMSLAVDKIILNE